MQQSAIKSFRNADYCWKRCTFIGIHQSYCKYIFRQNNIARWNIKIIIIKKRTSSTSLFPSLQPKHACTHIVFKALIPCLSGNKSDMKVLIVLQLQCQARSRFLFWNLRGCYKALQTLTCFCQCTAAEDLARAQIHSQPSLYLSRPFAQFSLTSTYNRHTEHTHKEEICHK